jgi:hypothetical protein
MEHAATLHLAADTPTRHAHLWAGVSVATNGIAQFSLVLLLAITSTEAKPQHIVWTIVFVGTYTIHALLDMCIHFRTATTRTLWKIAAITRGVLVVGIGLAVGFFAANYYHAGGDHATAVAEWCLAAFVLTHGLIGGLYVHGLEVEIAHEAFRIVQESNMQYSVCVYTPLNGIQNYAPVWTFPNYA